MCEFCDERGLPCLLCDRVTLSYAADRERCKGCQDGQSPPKTYPIFKYCPYCGRELELKNQGNNDEEGEEDTVKEKFVWTKEADYTARTMLEEGAPVADICDKLGCTDKQLYNHISIMRSKDPSYPKWPRKEKKERAVDAPTEEGKGRLSDFEQELVDMIEEREEQIREREEWVKELEAKLAKLESELCEAREMADTFSEDARELNAEKARLEGEVKSLRSLAEKLMADAGNFEDKYLARGDVILRMAEKMFGEVSA